MKGRAGILLEGNKWVLPPATSIYTQSVVLKVEYHANENPLTISDKNRICWSKVNA